MIDYIELALLLADSTTIIGRLYDKIGVWVWALT